MNTPAQTSVLPRALVYGLALLVILSVVAVAAAQFTEDPAAAPPAVLQEQHVLRFSDATDGSVLVTDSETNAEILRFEPGTNGFARGLLRGIGRERRKLGYTMEQPLALGRNNDGQLVLHDPLTRSHIVLAAFGKTNEGVFERLHQEAANRQHRSNS